MAVVAVLLAVLLAGAATSTAPPVVRRPPQVAWVPSFESDQELPPLPTVPEREPVEPADRELPRPIAIALTAILVVGTAALAVWLLWAAVQAWRNRPTFRWRRRVEADDVVVLDPAELAAAVAADAAAQRQALEHGTPRNAIVECWLRLEAVIVAAGLPRRPSDTSTDLVERTMATHAVDPVAIGELAALYREARFSSHPMGEAQRRAAIAALDAVHADLRAGAEGGAAVAGAGSTR